MRTTKKIPIHVVMITGHNIHETKTSEMYIKKFVAICLGRVFVRDEYEVTCLRMNSIDTFVGELLLTVDDTHDQVLNKNHLVEMCEGHNTFFVFDDCEPPELFNEAMSGNDRKITDPTISKLTIYRDKEGRIIRSSFYTF